MRRRTTAFTASALLLTVLATVSGSAQAVPVKPAARTSCHEWQLSDAYQVLCHLVDEPYRYRAYVDCGHPGGSTYRRFGPTHQAVREGQGAQASRADCGWEAPAVSGGLQFNP